MRRDRITSCLLFTIRCMVQERQPTRASKYASMLFMTGADPAAANQAAALRHLREFVHKHRQALSVHRPAIERSAWFTVIVLNLPNLMDACAHGHPLLLLLQATSGAAGSGQRCGLGQRRHPAARAARVHAAHRAAHPGAPPRLPHARGAVAALSSNALSSIADLLPCRALTCDALHHRLEGSSATIDALCTCACTLSACPKP